MNGVHPLAQHQKGSRCLIRILREDTLPRLMIRAATRAACIVLAVLSLDFALTSSAGAGSLAARFSVHMDGSARTLDHTAWTNLLQRFVVPGRDRLHRVDYARFREHGRAPLRAYLAALQTVSISTLDRPEQFAFWVNLYNALTIDVVLEHLPVESIRDIHLGGLFFRGPWKKKLVTVEGVELSLDDIEHEILRPVRRDPRIHYAVNCASIGCPNLARQAYAGARLDEMFDAAAKAYVNSQRGVQGDGPRLIVSSIYKWYAEDFGGTETAVLSHLKEFAAPALRVRLEAAGSITDYAYNWRLNNVR